MEKPSNFTRKNFQNVRNFKNLPNLRRNRQLMYLVIKYLSKHTNERLKKQSLKYSEDDSRRPVITEKGKN